MFANRIAPEREDPVEDLQDVESDDNWDRPRDDIIISDGLECEDKKKIEKAIKQGIVG